MLVLVENLRGRAGLNHLARVHHGDAVGDARDHAEVVRNEDDGGVDLVLQLHQQIHDLRLNRHIQRRRRLVGDQQLRVAAQRHGDHRALAHAAGKLVRILLGALLRVGDVDLL